MSKALMIQGTMSAVGKSFIVAGLCRLFKEQGISAAPFKSQNMALNSYVTAEGLEIGRAQAMQAEAAGVVPVAAMNPILLKPTGESRSQVIIMGRPIGEMGAREYFGYRKKLIPVIKEAYEKLERNFDIIVIEGAGSPAEINLNNDDIVNMGIAKLFDAPVLLAGDIERGGVFAQLLGTLDLLSPDERDRVCGLIVNKFRGDKTLFDDGIKLLEEKSGIPVAGVIPFCDVKLDEEDSLTDRFRVDNAVDFSDRIDIAIIRFPRISNFTDYDVFLQCDDVSVRYVSEDSKLKEPDLVILPGTKDTLADLRWLKRSGIFDRMLDLAKKDIPIVGICGGYQMLGRLITDEKTGDLEPGLDLLSVETILKGSSCKYTKQFSGAFQKCRGIFDRLSGAQITGYEIHEGVTKALDQDNIFEFTSKKSGYYSDNIYGTYIHGLFDRSEIASAIIKALGAKKGLSINTDSIVDQKQLKEENYKKLSDCLRENLDMELIKKIIT